MFRKFLPNSCERFCQVGASMLLGIVLLLFSATIADAQTLTPLYEFQGNADGANPNGVVRDSAGNLYGTTVAGGKTIFGTVFKLSPSGTKTILYNFLGGADGTEPHGSLVRDAKGNLYGTTEYGGDLKVQCAGMPGCGVVFKISPSDRETVLYRFTGKGDGGQPLAGLTIDSGGNLYGTTAGGGKGSCNYPAVGCGVVFKIDSTGKYTVLYRFTGGADGGVPEPRLILDSAGNIYGSTTANEGTIFKLDRSGHETTLLTFKGTNGDQPHGALALDGSGNLYGTTYLGGNLNDCNNGSGCGIVFQLLPDGQEPILNVFTGGSGGWGLVAGLVRDKKGNLYGTAALGGQGAYCCGVAFEVTSSGVENVLHTFTGGADGGSPDTDLIQDSSGNLYGGALGGTHGYGMIFKITP